MSEEGRLKMALERFVQATIPGLDYLAQYPGTIVAQSGQTFDFQPDSSSIPGIQGLSFFSGYPGITFTVDPSQNPRAVLFFQGGSPSSPALAFWGNPGLLSLSIGPNASLGAARVTDPIASSAALTVWMTAVVTGLAANTGAPITVPPPPTLIGTIQSGSTITSIA